jgi:hypothetical protein
MIRLLHTSVAGVLVVAIACTPEGAVAPSPRHESSRALGLYAKAIRSLERALATAEAHRSGAPKRVQSSYDQDIRRLKGKLAEFRSASGIKSSALEPNLFLEGGGDGGETFGERTGMIDREYTWTRVSPRFKTVYVQTFVTWPAFSITHKTSGKIKTGGREYPIDSKWSDFGWDAYQRIELTKVDCTTAGATIEAHTNHHATWMVRGLASSLDDYTTYGDDNGECPPVGPTARFTIFGGGSQAGAGNHLTIPVPSGGSAAVNLDASATTSDSPIASYSWYANGAFIGRGKSISYTVSREHVGFTLVVRDQNGKTSTAEGSVALQYPPEESCDGGGGGGETWRVTTGSPGAAPTASATGCSPPGGGTFETNAGAVWVYDVEVWLVCIRHDFYVSFDGGQTSQYGYSTYRNCRIEYRF